MTKFVRISTAIQVVLALQLTTKTIRAADSNSVRPNILFIYTDDQSSRTVSCYPEAYDWVSTPTIDSLAQAGVRFSHAYIGSWCMPSRATMLTGHHQHGIESMRMEGTYPGSAYEPELCPFWPKVFRENGYCTAQIGKWHTGVDTGYGRDWDVQLVWNRPLYPENAPNYYHDQLINFNGNPAKMVKGYTTDNYTDWAVEFINGDGRDEEKPWFLWLCYGAVHGPFTPAERHLDDYEKIDVPTPKDIFPPRPGKPEYVRKMQFWEPGKDGTPVERRIREKAPVGMKDFPGRPLRDWVRQYNQGVLAIDEGVARLLLALKETGQDDNTLIVFSSDQGFAWGQHGFKTKIAPYKATIGAPLIIRPPAAVAKKRAGTVVDEPVSGVDIPPTLFAQAGLKLPWEMHGHDLGPLLVDQGATWHHPAMVVHTARSYGSKTDKIPGKDHPELYHGPDVPWYVMLAQGRYKYVRTLIEGEVEELYDIKLDADELDNLALKQEYWGLLKKYRAAALAELERTDAELRNDLPRVAKLEERYVRTEQGTVPQPVIAVPDVCAWPNLTRLPDGKIIATIFNQPSHAMTEGDVECWASSDDGKTWEKTGTPAVHDPDTNRLNVAAGLAANGDLIALVSGWASRNPGGAFELDRVIRAWICRSRDGGKTWSVDKSGMPEQTPASTPVIPFGDIVPGQDGNLRTIAYGERGDVHQTFVYRSRDDGKSWGEPVAIDQNGQRNETALIHLGNGRWLAAARTDHHRGGLYLYESSDDANTWQFRERITGDSQHPAHFMRLRDGRLLLSNGNRAGRHKGVDVRVSDDEGQTWSQPKRVVDFQNDGGYPSSIQLPGGQVLTAYYAIRVAGYQGYHMGVVTWDPERTFP